MRLKVQDLNKTTLATLHFESTNVYSYHGDVDEGFKHYLENTIQEGFTRLRKIHDHKEEFVLTVEEPVSKADPNYQLHLKQYLERKGHVVIVEHHEVDIEINNLVSNFPDCSEKKKLSDAIPFMSYLEKTMVHKLLSKEKSQS